MELEEASMKSWPFQESRVGHDSDPNHGDPSLAGYRPPLITVLSICMYYAASSPQEVPDVE